MSGPQKVQVVARIDRDLLKEIDHLAVDWGIFRQEAVERLLRMVVGQERRQFIVADYEAITKDD